MITVPKSAERWIKKQRTGLSGDLLQKYIEAIDNDYREIREHIGRFSSVLDIGCGIAGIDAKIYLHRPYVDIYLLDKTGDGENIYGFQPEIEFYTDMDVAEKLLTANGVPRDKIIFLSPDAPTFPHVDIVISLLSWCHHYPVETYFDRVLDVHPNRIVVDIRKNTKQGDLFLKHYVGTVVSSTKKRDRWIFLK